MNDRPDNEIRREKSHENSEILEFFECCQQSKLTQAESLLKRKSLIDLWNGRDSNGRSLLHYCAECQGTLCAQLLISSRPASIINQDNDGYTILHLAVINGNSFMVTYLTGPARSYVPEALFIQFLNAGDTEGHTAFHWATVCNEIVCLDILYEAGASPSLPDIHGAHPLHYAAQMTAPSNSISRDIRVGLKILRKLLAYQKVNPNCRDKDGRSPLLWASSSGSSEAIMMLVNSGGDIASADKDGLTALHCASSRGHIDSVEALINMCGADIDSTDSIGCSPLFYAVTLGHADCTQLLLEAGAEPNLQDHKGRSAAHCGAAKGQFETIKILASHGGNLWLRNVRGDLPLHEAIKSGRKELVRWLLQQLPSTVNTGNSIGRSPLHIAASSNNVEMCQILLESGAEVNSVMKSRGHLMTPLDCALQKNYRSCAKFLLLHGALPASRLNLSTRTINQKLTSFQPNKRTLPKELSSARLGRSMRPASRRRSSSQEVSSQLSSQEAIDGEPITTSIAQKSNSLLEETRNSPQVNMMSKRKIAVYKNGVTSPDYSYSTEQSTSSMLTSQSIITNVYVNTVSKEGHKMAPLKRVKRRPKMDVIGRTKQLTDSSNSSQRTEWTDRSQGHAGNVRSRSEPQLTSQDQKTKTKKLSDLKSRTKLKENSLQNEPKNENRSRNKTKTGTNKPPESRLRVTSQSLDRSTRGHASKKRSIIGKSVLKHPVASDVDLSIAVSEQIINESMPMMGQNGLSTRNRSDLDPEVGSEDDYSEPAIDISNQTVSKGSMESTDSNDSVVSIVTHEIPLIGSDDSSTWPGNNQINDTDNHKNLTKLDQQSSQRKSEVLSEKSGELGRSEREKQSLERINRKTIEFSKNHSDSRCGHRLHYRTLPSLGPIDLSHVTAKVDTRGLDLARRPHSEAKGIKEEIKAERNEMMAKVEKSLRKYQLERKLFQELQDLKRFQIRSGRSNEPVLVKRLVDKFRKEVKSPGMADFNDSYTYRAYERFLYDQLRKLSSSNQGKVLPIIKSVSDENLALRFMKCELDDKSNNYHEQQNDIRQKSVSAMSTFNQSLSTKSSDQETRSQYHAVVSEETVGTIESDTVNSESTVKIDDNSQTNNNNNDHHHYRHKNSSNSGQDTQSKPQLLLSIEKESKEIETSSFGNNVDKRIKPESHKTKESKTQLPNNTKSKDDISIDVINSISESTPNSMTKSLEIGNQSKNGSKVKSIGREKLEEVKRIVRGSSSSSLSKINSLKQRTTAKHEQYKSLRGCHHRICLKTSEMTAKPYVAAAVNRPKFKRCKTSIPDRFEINIPLKEIEKRWRKIKEDERRKTMSKVPSSDESGKPMEFLLLYEINRNRRLYDADYGDDESFADGYGYDDNEDDDTSYEDDDIRESLHLRRFLKRTHSEPALIARDVAV